VVVLVGCGTSSVDDDEPQPPIPLDEVDTPRLQLLIGEQGGPVGSGSPFLRAVIDWELSVADCPSLEPLTMVANGQAHESAEYGGSAGDEPETACRTEAAFFTPLELDDESVSLELVFERDGEEVARLDSQDALELRELILQGPREMRGGEVLEFAWSHPDDRTGELDIEAQDFDGGRGSLFREPVEADADGLFRVTVPPNAEVGEWDLRVGDGNDGVLPPASCSELFDVCDLATQRFLVNPASIEVIGG
jgi:hypothetical protein